MKRIKAIQDLIQKETNSTPSSVHQMNAGTKLMNTAKNVIFPSDASNEDTKDHHDLTMGKLEQLREELDDIIASECVLCGDAMIKSVDQPFIGDEEMDVIAGWAI
jgi:hypothetical protein